MLQNATLKIWVVLSLIHEDLICQCILHLSKFRNTRFMAECSIMNSGLGFRGFLGFRVLGFFFFLAYAIIPSSLLNIGFTAKVFLGFQNPCRRRLASNAQRVRQKRKFHYCNKICQVYMREREREISVLFGCGF